MKKEYQDKRFSYTESDYQLLFEKKRERCDSLLDFCNQI